MTKKFLILTAVIAMSGISFSKNHSNFAPSSAEWVETDISDIAIAEGSALDLSRISTTPPQENSAG